MSQSRESSRGLAYGLGAYGLWGFFPLYWKLLHPSGALEILAHRIVWSVLVLGILVLLTHRQGQLRGILRDRRKTALLVIAATFVSINWGTYIYGVNHDRIVETALGYFINPLVTVGLGVVVLGERLRPLQWVSMGLALVAVLVLTFDYGHPPWIALTLAFSFGLYALVKKRASVQAIESLTFE
ncbi:MAG TPA: EamA family transporter RarD, partial [Marmoricola sp.]|nr:EamA family transporter RarD [Marmoricola sp.]